MKISIGGNLRRLRMEKGVTQERMAEAMNVSAQAISRWENDQAYPDIGMLPGLAMYFGVSTDEIMGMEGIRKEERLHGIMSRIYILARQGAMDEAIRLTRESLKVYPENSSLLMALGETLARKEGDEAALREAISAEERVLEAGGVSMKARSTTMVNLMFLSMRSGEKRKAEGLIRGLPHIWESREMVMPEIYEGEEYREELRKAARKAMAFLCRKIEGCEGRKAGKTPEYVQLGVEFERGMSDGEMAGRIMKFLGAERG